MQKYHFLWVGLIVFNACAFHPAFTATTEIQSSPVTATPTSSSGIATPTRDRSVENGQPLAARVNNQPILLSTFQRYVATFAQSLAAQGRPVGESGGQAELDSIRQKIFWDLVDQQLIEQYARQTGIELTDTELEAAARQLAGSSDQFEQWLAGNNLTYSQFLEQLRFQLLATRVFDALTGSVPPTAEQIRLTVLRVTDPIVADTLASRLAQGQPFAALAQEAQYNSQYFDWVPRHSGRLPPHVEDSAFALKPGDISGPIRTENGYYLIKLEGKEANRPLNSDAIEQLKQQTFAAWLQKQRAASVIEPFVALP